MYNFAYNHIVTIKAGQGYPDLSLTGYAIFARVTYDSKRYIYGLSNKSEYGDFLKWASFESFVNEIDGDAVIDLIDAELDYVSLD